MMQIFRSLWWVYTCLAILKTSSCFSPSKYLIGMTQNGSYLSSSLFFFLALILAVWLFIKIQVQISVVGDHVACQGFHSWNGNLSKVIPLNPQYIMKTKELQTPLDKLYQNQACSWFHLTWALILVVCGLRLYPTLLPLAM